MHVGCRSKDNTSTFKSQLTENTFYGTEVRKMYETLGFSRTLGEVSKELKLLELWLGR